MTCNSDLWLLLLQLIQNLPVGDIAHLVVLFHDDARLIANAVFIFGHHSIASLVRFADIAVETTPAVCTFAVIAFPHRPVLTLSKGAA